MGMGESDETPERMNQAARDGEADTYAVAPGAVARTVGDETVIVDLDTEQYFSLNPTGAVVWGLVSSGNSLDAATDELVRLYDVSRNEAAGDVAELVARLADRGLLVPSD